MRLSSVAVIAVLACAASPAYAQEDSSDVSFGPRHALPRAQCRPSDKPETDMQGRVPPADLLSGRALQGYNCNLVVAGRLPTTAFASLDGYGDCAYVAREAGAGGVQVVDVSDPATPLPADTLETPAMLDPWESLRVNGKRKLLVADNPSNSYLDVYDIGEDCRHPKLISSTDVSPALGHEGWFSPNGSTFWMSGLASAPGGLPPTLSPVDIRDPAQPKRLASWSFDPGTSTHGGSTTEDGTRSYVCQQSGPPLDELLVLDTSAVATFTQDAKPGLLKALPLGENQWCQGTYRVTYGGHPYLIQYGERSGAPDCTRVEDNWGTFAFPRIYDLADERSPRLVSDAMLESALPANCETVKDDALAVNGFGYSVHHCSPDRLYNPTILACSWFSAGLRVLDIRDPYQPRELAYFNPGNPVPFGVASRVVMHAERGEIWVDSDLQGFFVLKFEPGVWPFAGSAPCPEYPDYWFATYNETSKCATASFDGLGKPAPGTPGPAPAPSAGKLVPKLSVRARLSGRRLRVTGRLYSRGAPCGGRLTLAVAKRSKRIALPRNCRFATAIRLSRAPRRVNLRVRYGGSAKLRAVSVRVRAR